MISKNLGADMGIFEKIAKDAGVKPQ